MKDILYKVLLNMEIIILIQLYDKLADIWIVCTGIYSAMCLTIRLSQCSFLIQNYTPTNRKVKKGSTLYINFIYNKFKGSIYN